MTNINRSAFLAGLAGLLGIARAQTLTVQGLGSKRIKYDVYSLTDPKPDEIRPPEWYFGKALNNQCAVCGTMAEPDKKIRVFEGRLAEWLGPTRCKHCNAAFFQDAE